MATNDKGKTERHPHITESAEEKNKGKPSASDAPRQSSGQEDAVKRYLDGLKEVEEAHARVNINTKLVTKEFAGNVPNEPFKKDEEEDNKVGRFGFGAGVKEGVKEIKTIPLKIAGRVVDQIVVDPPPPGGMVAGASPLTEPQRVQQVLDKHFGKDKEKEGDSQEREEAEKKAAGTEA